MAVFIVRRTIGLLVVLFAITVLTFLIFFATPGIDPARLLEDNRAEVAQADEPQVRLDLAESENPRSPGRRAPEFLRRLTSDASLGSRSSR